MFVLLPAGMWPTVLGLSAPEIAQLNAEGVGQSPVCPGMEGPFCIP